jgi:hypothetical protein
MSYELKMEKLGNHHACRRENSPLSEFTENLPALSHALL